MRTKWPIMCNNKRILFSFLVIALSTVIAVNCISDTPPEAPTGGDLAGTKVATAAADPQPRIESPKSEQISAKQGENSISVGASANSEPVLSANPRPDKQTSADSKSAAQGLSEADSEVPKRRARSESSPSDSVVASPDVKPADKASSNSPKATIVEPKVAPKAAASKQASISGTAATSSVAASSSTKLAAKSKLPANLGTVTSTGSGGPAHYMSKHDAYSAIAEKHGALAQDAMRKSDKRQLQSSFGGIQKASGLGDMLAPFKGVSDSGLARTLGASMRSIMKSKYSVPAYVASALLGAVALMAFYESPISPLPVPALPEPPVGRFPPEMPNISPNVQVPFRTNQQQYSQQNYNQRSLYSGLPQSSNQNYLGQQAQQVLFPGASNNNAQQRSQMSASSSGPVQLAANLLGKQQIAQRKSGVDYDQSSSRSFFSPSAGPAQAKQGANSSPSAESTQQKQNPFLSFFGLGGNASPAADLPSAGKMAAQAALAAAAANNNNNQAGQMGSLNALEPKGQSAGLYNSNLVNKFKSFFSRSPAQPASATATFLSAHPLGPYDQYQRMSFVQALLKDNNFLPGFLSPSRKSSSTPTGTNQPSSAGNKLQLVSNAIASATSGTSPTARMQVLGESSQLQPSNVLQQGAANKQKASGSSGGYGFAKAADRLAHALLETFTSGVVQRSANPSNGQSTLDNSARKSSSNDDIGHSATSPISSILSDVISSAVYSAATSGDQQSQQSSEQVAPKSASSQQQSTTQQQNSAAPQSANNANSQDTSASGRSLDAPAVEDRTNTALTKPAQQQASATSNKQQQSSSNSVAPNETGHVRKTRSIGLEYAIDNSQELGQREQQPSKAAQINSVIDLIADSYSQNRFLFNFVMNRVGLSHAVPYVEQILASDGAGNHH